MHFHVQALPFGLTIAPMEFTVVVKEVTLLALQKGIRIHQSSTTETDPTKTISSIQTLVDLCQELGWLVNRETSKLDTKQIFNIEVTSPT